MANLDKKLVNRSLRAARVRAKVSGTAERPRLTVTISNKHISAQLIDDVRGDAQQTVGPARHHDRLEHVVENDRYYEETGDELNEIDKAS